tara:strand:- start:497 stop:1162 length:666 start_codon:yes stop_codon:yes gene_type:complete
MTKKSNKLINERVIRRWGKLANMPSLTENFLDTIAEDEMEDELAAAGDEVAAGEAEMEAGEEAEASVEETEAVEAIVSAVVDAISAETGVEIEVEGGADDEAAMDDMDAGMDSSDALDDAADDEMDAAMRDEDPAMRDPYNRTDELKNKKGGQGYDDEEDESLGMKDGKESTKKQSEKDRRDDSRGKFGKRDETLELEVIDDEALTEAVLKRVVERLLKKN